MTPARVETSSKRSHKLEIVPYNFKFPASVLIPTLSLDGCDALSAFFSPWACGHPAMKLAPSRATNGLALAKSAAPRPGIAKITHGTFLLKINGLKCAKKKLAKIFFGTGS